MLQLSCSEPAKPMESALGYAGKVKDIIIKPLGPAGSWQASGVYSCDLRKRAHALFSGAVNDAEVANTTNAEEDGILNDGHLPLTRWRLW
jgi:hypothetical protein